MFGIRATDPQPDTSLGLRRARALTMAMLALPGSAYLYQGEELGLPDHTKLDDAVRQDPAFERSGRAQAGRDGCRIPLPWEADRPAMGFSPTGAAWLPQPSSFRTLARDRQRGVEGSTLEMYRKALAIRRRRGLGAGRLSWLSEVPDGLLAFHNGDLMSVTNMGGIAAELPFGEVVLSSEPVAGALLEPNATAWLVPTTSAR